MIRVRAVNACAAACVIACCVSLSTLVAQTPRTITVRVDNDAFNFWRTPGERPDEEYTSGVHLIVAGGDAPWWARPFAKSLLRCTSGATACRTRTTSFGQDIYTPRHIEGSTVPIPGARQNAGWLYLSESSRMLRERRSDVLSLTIGVTGEPALAHVTQRLAHSLAPGFNRPIDWSTQLGFVPGVIVGYEHTHRFTLGHSLQILPRAKALIGNVTTAAEAGIRARTGVNMRHPWLPAALNAPFEVSLSAGASARAVARDLFLDGSTNGSGPSVGHEPFVHAFDWSITATHRWLTVSWGSVNESRAYKGGPAMHAWSSLAATVAFNR